MDILKLTFAPLEGVTGYIFRNAHHKYYGGVDRYMTPFLVPNQNRKFSAKERRDLALEHNRELCVIPQLLTNQAEDFLWAAKLLADMGYGEVNLNLGCPSGTVVSKGKGSGFLARREDLERFLETVYSKTEIPVSVKTRIGKDSPREFEELLKLFNQFPIKELIIHPRTQKDFYKNSPRLDTFSKAVRESKNPICYNGDLFSVPAFQAAADRFPKVDSFMLGRGAVANPSLPGRILEAAAKSSPPGESLEAEAKSFLSGENFLPREGKEKARERFRLFHQEIYTGYREILSGDRDVLFKMKELWTYWLCLFDSPEKPAKRIRKALRCADYEAAVQEIFSDSEFHEAGIILTK